MILDKSISGDGFTANFGQLSIYMIEHITIGSEEYPEYIGFLDPKNLRGDLSTSGDSDAVLLLQKNTYNASGNLLTKGFTRDADGSIAFKSAWTNRATETYR